MSLLVIRTVHEMQAWSKQQQRAGKIIGFVPTMGCLHDGHLSLMQVATKHADRVVVSIFVNPTQFGPNEDLDAYPRTWDADKAGCEAENIDVIFFPTRDEMYPPGSSTWVTEEVLTQPLCGNRRPTHFRGVTTVVAKLFNTVLPDIAVFGQKDAQQSMVIQRMVRDLNIPVKIIVAPIVRESDGLAMSSRNRYLSPTERQEALAICRGMQKANELFSHGERSATILINTVTQEVAKTSGRVDYIELRNTDSLEIVDTITDSALLAAAVYYGTARLLDNIILKMIPLNPRFRTDKCNKGLNPEEFKTSSFTKFLKK